MYSMYFNIADSFLCVFLVLFLLPRYAVWGYIAILYISEIFNFSLSIGRLNRVTELRFEPKVIVKSLIAGAGGVSASRVILYVIKVGFTSPFRLAAAFIIAAAVYVLLLKLLAVLPEDDRTWIYRLLRIKRKIK